MSSEEPYHGALQDVLDRRPDHVWIEHDVALVGWGVRASIDVGTGTERYRRAQAALDGFSDVPAFASFTFDVDEEGSVVLVPLQVARVDAGGVTMIEGILPPRQGHDDISLTPVRIVDDAGRWEQSFAEAMSALDRRQVEKVVLSRILQVSYSEAIPREMVVRDLMKTQPGSYVYSIQGLIGSSPELLASLRARQLRSVSLAGSAPRNADADSLLFQDKMVREHDFAAESVADALAPHCITLTKGATRQEGFADITHLATAFEGVTNVGTSILDIIEDLHPTAAVAGSPKKAAIELIRAIESHERGRYAGPVGWFDAEGNGTFAVAIRCGLIRGRQATLYAGAGLVKGSRRDEEFAETVMKLTAMSRVLQINPSPAGR